MLRNMEGEFLVHDPKDLNTCLAELIERDFDVEVLPDRIDPYGPCVWVRVCGISELDDSEFFDWLEATIEPLGGWVYEAGSAGPPPTA